MKKTLFSFSVIAMLLLTLASCKRNTIKGHGEVGDVQRDVASFSGIEIATPLETVITVDSAARPSITLNGYKNIIEHIKTDVQNNILHISTEERVRFSTDKDVQLTITVPSLSYFKISGTSDAHIKGNTKVDKMVLAISGAGDVVMDHLTANHLNIKLTGVGDLSIDGGTVNTADLKVSGAGEIDAGNVLCKNVKAGVTGVGGISVNVENTLDARISGAGKISYKGHPAITEHITGVGEIEDAN